MRHSDCIASVAPYDPPQDLACQVWGLVQSKAPRSVWISDKGLCFVGASLMSYLTFNGMVGFDELAIRGRPKRFDVRLLRRQTNASADRFEAAVRTLVSRGYFRNPEF